jgi:CHAT domain-containing protein
LDASNWIGPGLWPSATDSEKTRANDQKRRRDKCIELTGVQRTKDDPPPFDINRAHLLYQALIGPVAAMVDAKKAITIVPSGALSMLPFQALVSAIPVAAGVAPDGAHPPYNTVTWLGLEHPLSVLPSVANLRALRTLPPGLKAKRPYIGFGNPLLEGAKDNVDSARLAEKARELTNCDRVHADNALNRTAALTRALPPAGIVYRSGHADAAMLLQVEPLPETADELCTVAAQFPSQLDDADAPKAVWLGKDATEHNLKDLSRSGKLETFAVVHFATHGLLAGESELFTHGKSEPALVLTPPKPTVDAIETAEDDGLLTTTEIAALRLNADWVILSACNTAAGEADSAEALSGLARAFFFAGAKAVLVSHWPVETFSAQTLIKTTFSVMASSPAMSRAEAMRQAMRQLHAADVRNVQWRGHPAHWAPFTIVGEGRSLN